MPACEKVARNIIHLPVPPAVAVFLLRDQSRAEPYKTLGERNSAAMDEKEGPTWYAHVVGDLPFMITSMGQRNILPGNVMASDVSTAGR